MKTFRKVLATILCVLMIFGSVPLAGFVGMDLSAFKADAAEETETTISGSVVPTEWEIEDYGYTTMNWFIDKKSRVLTIECEGKMLDFDNADRGDAPWTAYTDYFDKVIFSDKCTYIGSSSLTNCTSLTSITIPDSVTSIGYSAFRGCTSLASITIPDSVTRIYGSAFSDCTSLTSIEIPDSVTYIDSYVFQGCTSLTSITVPDSVTSIGDYAFYECTGLTSITIPDSVTIIGVYAFQGCTSLASITIPDSVTRIADSAIPKSIQILCNKNSYAHKYASDNNKAFWLLDDDSQERYISGKVGTKLTWSIDKKTRTLTVDNEGAMVSFLSEDAPWKEHSLYITNVVINYGCTNIGGNAFYGCSCLKSIDIPYSVTSIGESAFDGCTGLTSIEIPDSVTSIGSTAFYECSSLTSIEIPDGVTSISDLAFYGCSSLTSIEIPDSVTSIGSSAFSGCSSLKNIIIPDSVTSIGNSAFSGCSSLTSIEIPDSVTTDIYGYMFSGCYGLKNIVIGNGVKYIDYSAFENLNIRSITIGSGVKAIGAEAFFCCYQLEEIYYTGDVAGWLAININKGRYGMANPLFYADKLYIGGELVTELVIPDNAPTVRVEAFINCSTIKSVVVSDGVTYISDSAFENCDSLESVVIGNGVTTIASSAFYDCDSLESVVIGNGVTTIASSAFYGCDSLSSVTVGKGVKTVGSSAFAYCPNLSDIYFYSKNCAINESSISIYATIHGYVGSTAEIFANTYGYEFIPIVDDPCDEHTFTNACDTMCNICGFKRETEHSFSEWEIIKEPDCMAYGIKSRTCSVCGVSQKNTVEKTTEHTYSDHCDVTCNVCGEIRENNHEFGEWILTYEPTCAEFGTRERVCSECGAKETDSVAKLTEHTFVNACDTDCDICGKTRDINHRFGEWVVTKEPTCTENGIKERVCATSGCVESKVIEVLSHTDENDDGICEVCNTQFETKPVYHGTCGDNLTWTLDESTGELVISGTGDMYDGYHWLIYNSSIKTVVISDGVTS
ncbi:MAG: leucine-rich repeat domain-containing protein, partial [Clostridia bacterium]|nr:leucine-rich repeat domain-containing protein [Clostridia bacterium]